MQLDRSLTWEQRTVTAVKTLVILCMLRDTTNRCPMQKIIWNSFSWRQLSELLQHFPIRNVAADASMIPYVREKKRIVVVAVARVADLEKRIEVARKHTIL